MPKRIKFVLNLLLLLTMVVEPVMFSYAMAGVGQHQGANTPMAAEYGQNCSSSMSHMSMPDNASHHQQDKVKKAMSDCCSTPVCGPAVLSVFQSPISETITEIYLPFNVAWAGIVLPSETKPPRSLLG